MGNEEGKKPCEVAWEKLEKEYDTTKLNDALNTKEKGLWFNGFAVGVLEIIRDLDLDGADEFFKKFDEKFKVKLEL